MKATVTALASAAFLLGAAAQGATLNGLPDDGQINEQGVIASAQSNVSSTTVLVGFGGGAGDIGTNAVFVFQLPELAPDQQFAPGATFRVFNYATTGAPNFNADLYGLGYRTSPDLLATDYFVSANNTIYDTNATLIQDNFLVSNAGSQAYSTSSASTALSDYLNAQYLASAADRQNGPVYVFLRLNPDVDRTGNFTRYGLCVAENGTAERRPRITYETVAVPEPASLGVLGLVAGALLARRRA